MAARCGVVVGVLAAPIVTQQGVSILLAAPDHIGASVFLLGSFLIIERAPARRFTPPLLAVILCAGQLGDATVLYVAVPAILLVSAYRILAVRRIRTGDTAIALRTAAPGTLLLFDLGYFDVDRFAAWWDKWDAPVRDGAKGPGHEVIVPAFTWTKPSMAF